MIDRFDIRAHLDALSISNSVHQNDEYTQPIPSDFNSFLNYESYRGIIKSFRLIIFFIL